MPRTDDLDPVQFHVPKGTRARIKAHAEAQGLEVSDYLRQLIEQDMNKGKRAKAERINLHVEPGAPRRKKAEPAG